MWGLSYQTQLSTPTVECTRERERWRHVRRAPRTGPRGRLEALHIHRRNTALRHTWEQYSRHTPGDGLINFKWTCPRRGACLACAA